MKSEKKLKVRIGYGSYLSDFRFQISDFSLRLCVFLECIYIRLLLSYLLTIFIICMFVNMNDKVLQQNISLWAQKYPKEAIFLPYTDCKGVEFCHTKKGELNLKGYINGHEFFYHSTSNALKEAQEWFHKLPLHDVEILYVFGVGLGYAYKAASEWLKQNPKHHLVFLEDDLAVIHRLFETEIGTEILSDHQVQLHYFANLEETQSAISELYWDFMSLKMHISALKAYNKHKKERFNELQHKLQYDATMRYSLVDEYLTYGVSFYRNFYPNLLDLPGAALGDSLVNKFQNVPAIICGAGPSMSKQLSQIGSYLDKALIFAGGSAMNALNAAGIQPHLGAGVDPNPEQYIRVEGNSAFEVPFLYRNRMSHRAFGYVHGPHLYVTGSGGYDVAGWFEEELGIKGEDIDEGFNVVNFCLDIARVWGCNPIIFVGLDLAFTEMEAYAKGVVEKSKVTKKELLEAPNLDDTALLKEDIHGNPVYTLWKWIAESNWIGDFSKEHSEVTIINATEGGIGFPGVVNMPLHDVAERYFHRHYDLKDRLQGEIQNALLPDVTEEKVRQTLIKMRDSLGRCQESLQILIEETEPIIEKLRNEKKVSVTLQTGRAALYETELSEEPGYIYVLEIFNIIFSKMMNQELRQILQEAISPWKQAIKKLELNKKKLIFLRDVASANVALINHSLENVNSKQ